MPWSSEPARRAYYPPNSYLVVPDRCWEFPELDQLASYLADPQVAVPAKVEGALSLMAWARWSAERAVLVGCAAADTFASTHDAALGELTARAHAGEPEDAADALGLAAQMLVVSAWRVRTGARADDVPKAVWPHFHRLLEGADELGQQALLLRPGDPLAAVARLTSGRGLGLPPDEWWPRFEVARKAEPTLFPGHAQMLQALCLKWYGSHDTLLDFARTTAEQAPAGEPVTAMLPLAHLELWLAADTVDVSWRREQVRRDLPLIDHCSRAFLTADAQSLAEGSRRRHPRTPEAHQLFGWMLWRENHPAAATHLARARGRRSELPWDYYPDAEATFRRALAETGVPPA